MDCKTEPDWIDHVFMTQNLMVFGVVPALLGSKEGDIFGALKLGCLFCRPLLARCSNALEAEEAGFCKVVVRWRFPACCVPASSSRMARGTTLKPDERMAGWIISCPKYVIWSIGAYHFLAFCSSAHDALCLDTGFFLWKLLLLLCKKRRTRTHPLIRHSVYVIAAFRWEVRKEGGATQYYI